VRGRAPCRVQRRWGAAASAALLLCVCRPVRADPQWTVGLVGGGAWGAPLAEQGTSGGFFGGVHGDVLLGRERERDFAVGPYARLASMRFEDARFSGGGSVLVPVWSGMPLVLSGGAFWRAGVGGAGPGVEVWGFWGLRGHNFHGDYSLANGVVFGWQREVGGRDGGSVVIGAQLDAALVALPFVLLYEAARR